MQDNMFYSSCTC